MKQIKVNSKCNGCGLCIMNCMYLEEDDEGNARPVAGMAVKSADIENVEKVIRECPEHALQMVETGTKKSGMEGVTDVINRLRQECDTLTVRKVKSSDVKLNIKDYYISVPYSRKEYEYEYSSEWAAKSAAKEEFERLCYSSNAFRPILKKVFVEYKMKVLKPYYDCIDEADSAYYQYNEYIREKIANAYAEICSLIGENAIPSEWKNFSFYLDKSNWHINYLANFEEESTRSNIITTVKEVNSGLDGYIYSMEFDDMEFYIGEGLFGIPINKRKWCFRKFYAAAEEFINDLKWAIDNQSYDIAERVADQINVAMENFEEEIKKEFTRKIDELDRDIQKFNSKSL